ncbi:MAG TPA: response regulator [Polyangiaceae bacterium]|jgi:two-component system response regulator HupR/HoxA|nr:response regulator [Polyangiaceae bacterium]
MPLRFPLSRAQRHAQFRREQLEEQTERPAVCIVEDDQDMLTTLSGALRDDGYRVFEAPDASHVVEWLSHFWGPMNTIDVIITDQKMPETTGLELLDKLRRRNWPTQVILMSAFADDTLRREAYRLGASAVMAKPFLLDDLIGEVNRLAPPG